MLRGMVGITAEPVMNLQLGGLTGASHDEKRAEHLFARSGYRHWHWKTRASALEICILRLRTGSYFKRLASHA